MIAACAQAGVAVVPFGGGTSVVGGVDAVRGAHAAAIALDLAPDGPGAGPGPGVADRARGAGPDGARARAAAGHRRAHARPLPAVVRVLDASAAGWPRARRARPRPASGGSTSWSRPCRCETPAGTLDTRDVPASGAGPSLRELVVGSEGVLGVITAATLRVREAPGRAPLRGVVGGHVRPGRRGHAPARAGRRAPRRVPAVRRGRDPADRRHGLQRRPRRATRPHLPAPARPGGRLPADRRLRGRPRRRRPPPRPLRRDAARRRRRVPRRALGPGVARRALRRPLPARRAAGPRASWSTRWRRPARGRALGATHEAVGAAIQAALAERGTPGMVMCHVSHLYPSGASLYFTFIARRSAAPSWTSGGRPRPPPATRSPPPGAAITHHHAVGRDHSPWMEAEVGPAGPGGPERPQGAPGPHGHHEPREAAAGRAEALLAGRGGLRRRLLGGVVCGAALAVLGVRRRRLELVELAAQDRVARVLAVLVHASRPRRR